MRVEMLTVPDCPNGPVFRERLMLALAGRADVELTEYVVDDHADAERRGMHGSPTLLVDGHDPFAAPGTPAGLSCRLYRGVDGWAGGAPSVEELRQVLRLPRQAPAVHLGVAGRPLGEGSAVEET
ncbi:hypothetical protein ACGFYV_20190 [Streptomyces sp. NPDC048297]|uniref:hypothetical protein n=1 Tax=Streptomyces sp. NPDC048297 TaxID=3365531 RepID=UPI00371323BE